MNNHFFIGLVLSPLLLFISCTQKQEITYTLYSNADSTYNVEIPSDVKKGNCNADLMNFEDKDTHLTITIQSTNKESLDDYIKKEDMSYNNFSYNLFHSSDTTLFYEITRGNNMWSAYDLYMLKKTEDKNYLIHVSSDVLSRSVMRKIIQHVYSSIKTIEVEKKQITNTINQDRKHLSLDNTYSTELYSIRYPKHWEVKEHLNEMTDAYIGNPADNFGFTIVHFETNYSLTEINVEANHNSQQAGFRILENKQKNINGEKSYITIQEIFIQNQKIKHISYIFKKGNILYNIKFGNVTTKEHIKLATEIMNSFQFNI